MVDKVGTERPQWRLNEEAYKLTLSLALDFFEKPDSHVL